MKAGKIILSYNRYC